MAQLQAITSNQSPLMRLGPFGGMDLSVTPSQISPNHSPDMLNFNIDERGALNKRTGYERIYATSLGTGGINGIYEYRKNDGTVVFLIAHGTKLYTQSGSSQPVQIYEGIANQQVNFFTMRDKCYLMDGANLFVYDGTECKEVDPYIPTIAISKEPAGGGTKLEDFNLLGSGFKDVFSATFAQDYTLSLKVLDDTPVKVFMNNEEKFEGVDFSVDRVLGTVHFFMTPTPGTNNLEVIAHKTFGTEMLDYFNATGVQKIFYLSRIDIDSTPVQVSYDGGATYPYIEGDGSFTVNREKGIITFTSAPTRPGYDPSLVVKHFKKSANMKEQIKKCRFHVMYGGSNDTRLFISGNPDLPNQMWRSGLYDPTYWPENGFYKVGSDSDKIQGFSKQYDYLVIHKEYTLWNMQYVLNNGEPSFPIKPINDQVGTLARGSIQIIENNPVSLSKNGIYALVSSNVRDERNIQYISERIDPKLLKETDLSHAISIDFNKKYWLAVNGKVIIYDYAIKEWLVYDNIPASCFLERDGVLHFASSQEGLIYRFKDINHLTAFEDDGQPINAYWVSKLFDFDMPEYQKVIQRLFLNLKPNTHTSVNVYYRTDRKGESFVLSTRMDKVDFQTFDFTRFGFITSDIPQEVSKKVKLKKINYLQLKLVNDQIDEGLGLMNLSIKYSLQNEVK